jgi:hypothetical protein
MSFISRLRQKYQTGGVETSTNGSKFPARFFIHIPKTAGTSFRQSVVDHFGQKKVLQDYGGKRAATSAAIREYIYATGDTTSITEAMASEDSVMVSGHVHAAKYAGTIGLPNTMTFVRQPVDRVVSHYRHMVRDEGFEGGLMSFAREPAYRNTQSRVMDFLDPALFGVVGITEQYQSSIDLVNAHWNWRLSHRADNVSDKMSGLKVIPSAEEEALITDLNSKDVALCDRAHHVFKNSLFCLTLDLKSEPRGAISTARDKQGISGWSFNMFSDQPSEIEVLVNQEIKGNLKCVDFRPALAGWKVPRNGYIGFHLRSVSLNEGDTVEIRDIEHQLILDSTIV